MVAISIIIPVFNVEKYIAECIESIAKQTFKDFEVILIDDSSTDKSLEVIQNYMNTLNLKMKIVEQPRRGVSAARNLGIKSAEGEYLLFVDADDHIDPSTLEIMYSQAINQKADVVVCNARLVYDNGMSKNCNFRHQDMFLADREVIIKYFLTSRDWFVWNKLVKRSIINMNRLKFDESLVFSEDNKFVYELYNNITKVAYIDKVLYNYRQQQNSVSKQVPVKAIEDQLRVISYITHSVSKDIMYSSEFKSYCACMVLQSKIMCIKCSLKNKNGADITRIKDLVNKDILNFEFIDLLLSLPTIREKIKLILLKTKLYKFILSFYLYCYIRR